ncbi:MAG TPA: hypothetical protein VMH36_27370, partial [Alphaproteobacteria bacterium]|nr:hypothetical protein [Alphaproteobacteria bacterium]
MCALGAVALTCLVVLGSVFPRQITFLAASQGQGGEFRIILERNAEFRPLRIIENIVVLNDPEYVKPFVFGVDSVVSVGFGKLFARGIRIQRLIGENRASTLPKVCHGGPWKIIRQRVGTNAN